MPDFSVDISEKPEHGDYASNVAMVLAKTLKRTHWKLPILSIWN